MKYFKGPNLKAIFSSTLLALSGILLLVLVGHSFVFGQSNPFAMRKGDRVRGNHNAPVTLLEYSDFTCGFCQKFFQETWPQLLTDYVEKGKVRLIYRDFPRAMRGPGVDTALAARCAGEQGQYWEMHDHLFSNKATYGAGPLEQQAAELGLNREKFSQCFQSGRYLNAIFEDLQEGGALGIRGTPGFVLFLTQQPEGGPKLLIPGAFPYEVFKEQIDTLMKKAQG